MKRFLRVFIIVLLVLGVIGGTSYFFFKKVEEKNNTTASIAGLLQSEDKVKFNQNLKVIAEYVNSDGTDDRMNLIILTSEKLDNIVYILSTYHIDSKTKINNEQIANKLDQVESSRNLLTKMINEYNIKKDSPKFDRHLGANDLYLQACTYLVNYANFANLLNQNLDVDKMSDIKFNMFEIYTNVVVETFSKVNDDDAENTNVVISNSLNIDAINEVLKIRNSYIVKIENENTSDEKITILVTSYNNAFNTYYNKCNKTSFAKNLAENLELSTNLIQPNNERTAAYYFNLIYGI